MPSGGGLSSGIALGRRRLQRRVVQHKERLRHSARREKRLRHRIVRQEERLRHRARRKERLWHRDQRKETPELRPAGGGSSVTAGGMTLSGISSGTMRRLLHQVRREQEASASCASGGEAPASCPSRGGSGVVLSGGRKDSRVAPGGRRGSAGAPVGRRLRRRAWWEEGMVSSRQAGGEALE